VWRWLTYPLEQAMMNPKGSRRIALLLNLCARWGWAVNATLRPLYSRERLATRMLGGPQGRSELMCKISPPSGFDPRTVQPVESRYIDIPTKFKIGRPATSDVSTRDCSRHSSRIQWWSEARTKPLLNLSLAPRAVNLVTPTFRVPILQGRLAQQQTVTQGTG
jgi:hypothetical protein